MTITLLGFPWDASSSYARGPALAPPVVRAVLFAESSSPFSIAGVDAREAISAYDFADLPSDGDAARASISARISAAVKAKTKPLSLGGDHSVTFPILNALKDIHGPMNILHVDAHTDLYEEYEGDPFSHACPFARAIEAGCVNTLVQVGLRSVGPAQRAYGEKHGVVMLGADEADAIPYERLVCAGRVAPGTRRALDPRRPFYDQASQNGAGRRRYCRIEPGKGREPAHRSCSGAAGEGTRRRNDGVTPKNLPDLAAFPPCSSCL